MVNSVNQIDQLAQVIRRQVSLQAARGSGKQGQRAGQSNQPQSGQLSLQDLVASRVAALDPNDPQNERRAFRIFLETVLLSELGPQMMNDPAFYQLVADVHGQMEADPALQAALSSAGRYLLNQKKN